MKLLEIHIIQTVAPSNLNRDDTGSPKDALFGGYRRGRISSQAQKRAVRQAFQERALFTREELAVRTRRLLGELLKKLKDLPEDQARIASENALNALGLQVKKDTERTEYLVFMGHRAIDRLAELIRNHLKDLLGEVRGKKSAEVDGKLQKSLREVLEGDKAVDLALFGRMLADRPEFGVDAAAQVAHALSTHKVDREFDFYTAVDDLNPREETGAGMMGEVEYYSATLYRYATINLDLLLKNLDGDAELAKRAARAFLESFALTLPSGKQNSFAAHNPPRFVAFRAGVGMPRNLATAFENPVRPQDGQSLSALSVERLVGEWAKLDQAYGPLKPEWRGVLDLTGSDLGVLAEAKVESMEKLLEKAEEALEVLLEDER